MNPVWHPRQGGADTVPRPASLDDVLAVVRHCVTPLGTEHVALADAAGRILREPVRAETDQPAFDRSAVDGWAIRMDDTGDRYRVLDRLRAGEWRPRPVSRGETVWVATGAALPASGLQVIPREQAECHGDSVRVLERDSSRNIRFRGEDARAGQVILPAGARLNPASMALLASVGCARPCVGRLPRVVHGVTGDELLSVDAPLLPGMIRDSNRFLVAAWFRTWGVTVESLVLPESDPDAFQRLEEAVQGVDAVIISGGASVGDHDDTRSWLSRLGYVPWVEGLRLRPGKPLWFGVGPGGIAVALPGNPLAHHGLIQTVVRQMMAGFLGSPERWGVRWLEGTLARSVDAGGGPRETLWPVRWEASSDGVLLWPLPWNSSGDLTLLAEANALMRVSPGSHRVEQGTPMRWLPTDP